jgi:monoamine oxidase
LLEVTEQDESNTAIVLGGRRLSAEEAQQLRDEMKRGTELMVEAARPIDADEPWNGPDAQRLDGRSLAEAVNAMPITALGKRGLLVDFTHEMGLEPAQASYLADLVCLKAHGLEAYFTDTEAYHCQGGNQQLADRLAERLGPDRLHRDMPVASIAADANKVTVRTRDGREHEADDVVLAIPPSVWGRVTFDPPLPRELLQIQMGLNTKYLAALRDRFWRAGDRCPRSMSEGEMGWVWEATDAQPGQQGAALVSYAGGPSAEACRRRGAAERSAMYRREFERLLPGFAASFVQDRFVDWLGDEWTRGSYTFPAPGQLLAYGPVLRRGLGRLHFAGEHASKFRGYMEGALDSGVALARRLAVRDGLIPA